MNNNLSELTADLSDDIKYSSEYLANLKLYITLNQRLNSLLDPEYKETLDDKINLALVRERIPLLFVDASKYGHVSVVKYLTVRYFDMLNTITLVKLSFEGACHANHLEIVEYISVVYYGKVTCDYALFMQICISGYLNIVKILVTFLNEHQIVSYRPDQNGSIISVLHSHNQYYVLQWLLQQYHGFNKAELKQIYRATPAVFRAVVKIAIDNPRNIEESCKCIVM